MANFKVLGGDLNGDGRIDLVWRDLDSGENYYFPMSGTAVLAGEGAIRTVADLNWQLIASGDFDGDAKDDLLWRNTATGENYLYFMDGRTIKPTEGFIRTVADQNWQVAGVGDFDGDAKDDILWRNAATGQNYVYFMDGKSIKPTEGFIRTVTDQNWQVVGIGDFDGDAKADILWRNAFTGENYLYFMDGKSIKPSEGYLRAVTDQNWQVAGVGDFNGDARSDIVWRNSATGENYVYLMNGKSIVTEGYIRTVADQNWQVETVGDFDGDGKDDIFWRNEASGENYLYPMDGLAIKPSEGYVRSVGGGEMITGTEGDDSLTGTPDNDTIDGLGGNDTINGNGGSDSLDGGDGDDIVASGVNENPTTGDTLIGGNGNDTLDSSQAQFFGSITADTLHGGLGNDLFVIDHPDEVITDTGGIDTVMALDMDWTLGAGFENLHINNDRSEGPNTGIGNELDNLMTLAWGGGRLEGRGGNDTLHGGVRSSSLFGGDGNDELFSGGSLPATMDGGAGNDTLHGGSLMTGGPGADHFVVMETITDFISSEDRLRLDGSWLQNTGPSGDFATNDDRFWAAFGAMTAHDAGDRVIYDMTTGNLYYDADGTGTQHAPFQLATLQGAPSVSAADFYVVNGSSGMVINGTSGDDSLVGGPGNDTINAFAGNDTLDGRGGADVLDGGTGDDTYIDAGYTLSEDTVVDAGGLDTAMPSTGTYIELLNGVENLTVASNFVTPEGYYDGVYLYGNASNNVIRVQSDDFFLLNGQGGNDTLIGGPGLNIHGFDGVHGDDSVDGAAGYDVLSFGDAAVADFRTGTASTAGGSVRFSNVEEAFGSTQGDRFTADDAGRFLTGYFGADTLIGGAGNDFLTAGYLNPGGFHYDNHGNQLSGGAGNDSVWSGAGSDTLAGGAGNDEMEGFLGSDVFLFDVAPGDANADLIFDFGNFDEPDEIQLDARVMPALGGSGTLGGGDARFASGAGFTSGRDSTDRVVYDTNTGDLYYDADGSGSGAAQLIVTLQGAPALDPAHIRVINGTDPAGQVINGTAGNDSLVGGPGNDTISGLAGNDTLRGLGGNDLLDGGAGVDSLDGGVGDDTYVVTQGDVIVVDPSGIDTVMSSVSWALPANSGLENLTLTGSAVISGQGNQLNNRIEGNSAANTLSGRAGNDTVIGNDGNDVIDMSAGGTTSYGNDLIDGGSGFDTLDFLGSLAIAAIDVNLAANVGNAGSAGSFTIFNIERVYGGNFNDAIGGDAAANQLYGQGGNDWLSGARGVDTLSGGAGSDAFYFGDPAGAANADRIVDFVSGTDELQFEGDVLNALGTPAAWAAGDARFNSGAGFTSGRDSSDRLLYDTNTGNLYYDADGSGSGASQLVFTLQGIPSLTASDITVI